MGISGKRQIFLSFGVISALAVTFFFALKLHQSLMDISLEIGKHVASMDQLINPTSQDLPTSFHYHDRRKQFTKHITNDKTPIIDAPASTAPLSTSQPRRRLVRRSIRNQVQQVFMQDINSDHPQKILRTRTKYMAKQSRQFQLPISRFETRPSFHQQISDPCKPNLLVIGAQKAGTTSWHIYMKKGYHPNVLVPSGKKECDYFSYKLDEGVAFQNYTAMFPGSYEGVCKNAYDKAGSPLLRAEASPNYLVHPLAASRAKHWLPQAKILVILRDPVSRLISAFNMKWQERVCGRAAWRSPDCYRQLIGRRGVTLKSLQRDWQLELDQIVRTEIDLLRKCYGKLPVANNRWFEDKPLTTRYRSLFSDCFRLTHMKPYKLWEHLEDKSHVYRSVYIDQLLHWFHAYGDHSIIIWSAEEFESTPRPLMRQMTKWLGLNEGLLDETVIDGKHHSRSYIAEILPETENLLREFFRPHNERLFTFLEAKGFYDTARSLRNIFK